MPSYNLGGLQDAAAHSCSPAAVQLPPTHLIPQQTMVHKDAVQPVSQDLVHHSGCNSAVYAARQRTNGVLVGADLQGTEGSRQQQSS